MEFELNCVISMDLSCPWMFLTAAQLPGFPICLSYLYSKAPALRAGLMSRDSPKKPAQDREIRFTNKKTPSAF